jgi:hypothetical protein
MRIYLTTSCLVTVIGEILNCSLGSWCGRDEGRGEES